MQTSSYEVAVRDFQRARKEAALQQILARLRGQSDNLLCYDDVRRQLRPEGMVERGLQEIPVSAIVGSVGRSQDFTRQFLPKKQSDEQRWANVRAAINDLKGMPPIEVYQVGEAYFVKDGNHRVSVARQLGSESISAYVMEVKTRVPLSPEADPTELICKTYYLDFLEQTNLDQHRPDMNLQMTFCEQYTLFMEQIKVEQTIASETLTLEEAAVRWYDTVYLPVARLVQEQGLLHQFPNRTEADLYLLLSEHRTELEQALSWQVDPETAVSSLANKNTPRPLTSRLWERLVPDELEEAPVGKWRAERLAIRQREALFTDLLVPVLGATEDWWALDVAIEVAKRENGRLHGLHLVPNHQKQDQVLAQRVRSVFTRKSQQAGFTPELAIAKGQTVKQITKHAIWNDLIVVSLTHPPGTKPLERINSPFNNLIQRSPRPILAVPSLSLALNNALLCYDGSAKSDEALFVSAYLANKWGILLTVLTVETENTPPTALEKARSYLTAQQVTNVTYELRRGSIGNHVLTVAQAQNSNLLILGGFGFRPFKQFVLGSTVDFALREFKKPILICR